VPPTGPRASSVSLQKKLQPAGACGRSVTATRNEDCVSAFVRLLTSAICMLLTFAFRQLKRCGTGTPAGACVLKKAIGPGKSTSTPPGEDPGREPDACAT